MCSTMKGIVALIAVAVVADYSKEHDWRGPSFFDNFNFETFNDPTHGYVDFQARGTPLAYSQYGKVYMKVDTGPAYGRGRKSVRIHSKLNWNNGLFILDVPHMPDACGAWPAWWFNGEGYHWPECGEIDVIEYVHQDSTNAATLHTSPGCSTTGSTGQQFTGNVASRNCNDNNGYNGCGIHFSDPTSAAGGWNKLGGGVYIMERIHGVSIKVWYFHRDHIPSDIQNDRPDPSTWGTPAAAWSMTENACSASHFKPSTMIFDITFCGDWAGNVWNRFCPNRGNSCVNYVRDNGHTFTEAYWEINYVKVFQKPHGDVPTPPSGGGSCTPAGQDPYQTGQEMKCCAGNKKCLVRNNYGPWSYKCQGCNSWCPDDKDWNGRQCNAAASFALAAPELAFTQAVPELNAGNLVARPVAAMAAADDAPTNCACMGIAAGCSNENYSCYVGSDILAGGRDKCVPGACSQPRQCFCDVKDGDTTKCNPFWWHGDVPKCWPNGVKPSSVVSLQRQEVRTAHIVPEQAPIVAAMTVDNSAGTEVAPASWDSDGAPDTRCACMGVAAGCENEWESCYVGYDLPAFGRTHCVPNACRFPRKCLCNRNEGDTHTFCGPFFWQGKVKKCYPTPHKKPERKDRDGVLKRLVGKFEDLLHKLEG